MCCRKVSPPATKAELAIFHCLLDDQLWATAPQILPLVLSLEVVPFQEGQVTKGTTNFADECRYQTAVLRLV